MNRLLLLSIWCLSASTAVLAGSEATLFRMFLTDGTAVVSYGEFARVADRVVFSMPIGGPADAPRLHLITLPAGAIDWPRTERYAASARYYQYAETRGEEDFRLLTSDIALVLNEVALTTDRQRALAVAEEARLRLVDWPRSHYGYRQRDVHEIVTLLDEAISDLRAAMGISRFDLSLVAAERDVPLEPIVGLPSAREQVDQLLRMERLTERAADRVALLQSVLLVLDEARGAIPPAEAAAFRRTAESRIRDERAIDARFTSLSRRLAKAAARGAARARVTEVERVLHAIPGEDAKLGRRRPEAIEALRSSVENHLDDARRLRLLRDRWSLRRALYRDYQRSVGAQLLQLVKSQPALEAVRRLDGPAPRQLAGLRAAFAGGGERLSRLTIPDDLRTAHGLLVGAWRFAENAFGGRYDAAQSGNVDTAWAAASSASGALLLLSRAQQEIRALLELPQLR